MLEDGTMEEDKGVESLFLSGGGDVSFEDEVVKEGADGIGSEGFRRVSGLFESKAKVVADPLAVCFFGSDSLSGEPQGFAGAIQDVGYDGGRPGLQRLVRFRKDRNVFTEEVAMCSGRGFCFQTGSFPIKGIRPGKLEKITGQDSCRLKGLIELPVGEMGRASECGEK